ncbi:type VI secretion system baseplate subunit TssG [Shewanella chilikensis]|uniref:type VI secretion system baseplate subunit TssG n=1 Tax=Shewanella chilikensis TaxID=558541 RepID=UPI001F43571E|nr:type VI secretion system baseplate subunit TssG [Shewanella chilikensis]MCE9788548.1 type VI secretion system baseplate subunit TssG [Shewanella chilikensis]
MGYPERSTTADITFPEPGGSSLPQDYREYSFFQLVELLHQMEDRDPEDAQWELAGELQFSANPSLGFAPADISMLESLGDGRLRLETCFLGLNGAQSPLPSYLLDMLLEDEDGIRRNFLDFFNNRLISLFYRLWRKYRYYVRFQDDASDSFSAQVYALVGLANEDIRGDTPINWCKMLAYAGMLAGRSRSPQAVAGIVAHCFDLPQVSIRQWQLRQVEIPESQRCRLGVANSRLGEDSMLGERVGDLCGKFVLCMEELSPERFRDFLPSGREFQPLCKVMEVILREQMAYDLELTLREDEAPLLQLGEEKGGQLGWSSFLGKGDSTRKSVLIQIRQ